MSISHGTYWYYKNALKPNQKHFILIESGKLWTSGPNVSKIRVITYNNKTA